MAQTYFESGQFEEAMKVERKCLFMKPEDSGMMNRLAWWELTVSDEEFRNAMEALKLAEKAVAISKEKEPLFWTRWRKRTTRMATRRKRLTRNARRWR